MLAPRRGTTDLDAHLFTGPSPDRVTPLPPWSLWFKQLGREVAGENGAPLTYALALPTRTFAAVFTAFGLIHARCSMVPEDAGHYEELWNSDLKTAVRYRQGNREFRGILVGKEERNGTRYLAISSGRGGRDLVPENMAHNIISAGAAKKHPKNSRQLAIQDPWLARMLEGCDEGSYQFHSRHDCLLVGHDNALREEANLQLHLKDTLRQPLKGSMDCMLRVKRWQTASKAYNSEVLPQSAEREEAELAILRRFHAVIFDGAGAYLRWRRLLGAQHHIVLLDRTDTRFAEAAEAVNQAIVKRQGALLTLPKSLPPGVEGVAFRRLT